MKKFIVALSLMLCGLFSVAPAQTSRGTVSGTVVASLPPACEWAGMDRAAGRFQVGGAL